MKFPHSLRFLFAAALLAAVPVQAQLVGLVMAARAATSLAIMAANSNKQNVPGLRADPTFWFVGMKNPKLQLLLHSPALSGSTATLLTYDGVTLDQTRILESPNYLLLDLSIAATAKPGLLKIELRNKQTGKDKRIFTYELKARNTAPGRVQGVTSADFVYMLMPDRFANGDPSNDVVKGMNAPGVARDSLKSRHGGDIKGIENHFGYLKELGVTAIWPAPVVENNQPKESYHGYALTDYYNVDARFGTTAQYAAFVEHAHAQGLKVIHDVVLNHIGNQHYLFRDPPARDWFHQWPAFTRSNFRDAAFNDPYASAYDRKLFGEGWFDTHMPDVNQTNPLVTTYLIQNFLWWVEYTGLDGYRIDTYSYSDRNFLMQWGAAILDQYPQLGMFGETWVQGTAQQAYFARNILPVVDGFKSNLPGVTDFQLQYAINEALTRDTGWTEGINKLYYTLQADWLYEDPNRNVVFLDNHDLSRFFSVVGRRRGQVQDGHCLAAHRARHPAIVLRYRGADEELLKPRQQGARRLPRRLGRR